MACSFLHRQVSLTISSRLFRWKPWRLEKVLPSWLRWVTKTLSLRAIRSRLFLPCEIDPSTSCPLFGVEGNARPYHWSLSYPCPLPWAKLHGNKERAAAPFGGQKSPLKVRILPSGPLNYRRHLLPYFVVYVFYAPVLLLFFIYFLNTQAKTTLF